MRWAIAALLGSVAPVAGASQIALTCTFATECIVGEACNETAYSVTLEGTTGAPEDVMGAMVTMTSDAETVEMTGMRTEEALIMVAGDPSMYRILTITPGGALLTTHIASVPMAITYAGTCE